MESKSKDQPKLSLEERITNIFTKILNKPDIQDMFKQSYDNMRKKLDVDYGMSESKKIGMVDKCDQLKSELISGELYKKPDMMDILGKCDNIDIKSSINHYSAAAAAGGGHKFF